MKYRAVDLLACPECGATLSVRDVFSEQEMPLDSGASPPACKCTCAFLGDAPAADPPCEDCVRREVTEGLLGCTREACGERYPIIGGIPRLLTSGFRERMVGEVPEFFQQHRDHLPTWNVPPPGTDDEHIAQEVADSYSYQWNTWHRHYTADAVDQEAIFLDYIDPWSPDVFEGKTVLDAGCGMGRFAAFAGQYGAEVVAFDLGGAVQAAYETTRSMGNVHVVQASLDAPPVCPVFDLAFSIGVIMILPDPPAGVRALARKLRTGGKLLIWVYGRENNFTLIHLVEPWRKHLVQHAGHDALYWMSLPPAVIWWAVAKGAYAPANRLPGLNRLMRRVQHNEYFMWVAKKDLRFMHCVVFDLLVPEICYYATEHEVHRWMQDAGLDDVQITPRFGKSWRGIGRVREG